MKQEDKELLLKDLCARLPYKPLVRWREKYDVELTPTMLMVYVNEGCQPYLRSMSSITEDEEKELAALYVESMNVENISSTCMCAQFYYKHHIDGMGLISKGLALEAPEEMYKTE